MTRITTGNRNPRNLSINSKGSIHDDATATDLGFRAGTVAGDIHLEQFGQILVDGFGQQWFENGWLSMYFQQATADREPVEAWLDGEGDIRTAGINTPEGAVVAEGNAGLGAAGPSALYARHRRSVDPSQLRMLRDVRIGQGKENARKFLIDNPDMAAEIEEKIRADAGLVDIEELTKDEAVMVEGQDSEPVIGEVAG